MATLQKYLVGVNIEGATYLLATTPSGLIAFFSDVNKLKEDAENGYRLAVLDKPDFSIYKKLIYGKKKKDGQIRSYKKFFFLKVHSLNNPFKLKFNEPKTFQENNIEFKTYRYSVKTTPDVA